MQRLARADYRPEEGRDERHGDKHQDAEATDPVSVDDRRVAVGDGMTPEATPRPEPEDERDGRPEGEQRQGKPGRQHRLGEVRVTPKPAEKSTEHDAPGHTNPSRPDRGGLPTPRAHGRGETAQPLEEGSHPGRLAVLLE